MADTIIDRLLIAFGINADGVQKGMSKAERIIHKGIDSIKSVIMPLATGFALTSMVQGFVEGATEAAKAAERLGMSMEDLQAWQGAVQALGAESSVAGEILGVLNEKLVDAAKMGGTGSLELFKKLGISIKDNAGNMRLASDVLLDLAGASERLSKQELYGYSKALGLSPEMIDLLVQGRKGLEDLLKAQKELAVFQKEDAEIAKKGRIAWQAYMKSLQAVQAVIMRAVLPVLTKFVEYLTKATVWARNNQPFMIALITGLALVIGKMLVPAMIKMAAAGWASMAPLLPWIALITLLALAVDDLWTYFEGGENALPPVVNWLIIMLTAGLSIYKMLGGSLIPALGKLSKVIFHLGMAMFKTPLSLWILAFAAIAGAVYYVWNAIKSGQNVLDKLKADIMSVVDAVNKAWTAVEEFFGFTNEQKNKNEAVYDSYINPFYTVDSAVARNVINPQAGVQNNKITSSTSVGSITISTQATDAAGIAKEISPALKNEFDSNSLVMAANTGVIVK